jgi:N-acetylglutamate synthase-like GNAT family acetyltransferase
MPVVRSATDADAERIHALLDHEGLPTSDLAAARPEFIVVVEATELVGAGALQHLGESALIRSVAVSPKRRGTGLGRDIVLELERRARSSGTVLLVLLTQTAAPFFEHLGYRVIERASAPAAVQSTEEFRSLCPASAVCMSKKLTEQGT